MTLRPFQPFRDKPVSGGYCWYKNTCTAADGTLFTAHPADIALDGNFSAWTILDANGYSAIVSNELKTISTDTWFVAESDKLIAPPFTSFDLSMRRNQPASVVYNVFMQFAGASILPYGTTTTMGTKTPSDAAHVIVANPTRVPGATKYLWRITFDGGRYRFYQDGTLLRTVVSSLKGDPREFFFHVVAHVTQPGYTDNIALYLDMPNPEFGAY